MTKITNLWSKKDTPTSYIIHLSYTAMDISRSKEIDCKSKVEINSTLNELIFCFAHMEKMNSILTDLEFSQNLSDLKRHFVHLGKCESVIAQRWLMTMSTRDDYEYVVIKSIGKLRKVIIRLITKLEDEQFQEKRQMSNDTA